MSRAITERTRSDHWQTISAPVILVLVALLMTAGIWHPFALFGHSAPTDYFRQLTFDRCFRSGDWYPRYVPDTYFGYGSPIFHFYAPLPYYVTECFVLLGLGVAGAIKSTLVLALVLSGLGMYLFCRDFTNPPGALLAGLAYMFTPYHLVDMFVRHALGEHVAFAFLPFAAWGISGMIKGGGPLRLIVGAASFAGLILSHNITALLGTAVLGLWWLALLIRRHSVRFAFLGVMIFVLGLSLSAFFWVPAMADMDLTWAEGSLTRGYFVYHAHFVHPKQLIEPGWGFGGSNAGTERDRMSFQIGLAHIVFVLLAILYQMLFWKRSGDRRLFILYNVGLFTGSLFMTLGASRFLWRTLPFLPYVQFPWRFLVFAGFSSSALSVAVAFFSQQLRPKWIRLLVIGVSCGLLLLAYARYAEPRFMLYDLNAGMYRKCSLDRARARAATGRYLNIWELGGVSHMHAVGETGTSRDDFLPATVRRKPKEVPRHYVEWIGDGDAILEWEFRGPVDLSATVDAPSRGFLEFKRFDFPGWRATVSGKPTAVRASDPAGTILVPVPKGTSHVVLEFASTPLRRATGAVSLVTFLGIFTYGLLDRIRRKAMNKQL